MSGGPYLAAEDSALIRGALKGYEGLRFLEIGAGNGGNLASLSGRFSIIVGTDLSRPSMHDWSESGADFVLADRGTCFGDECFDLVAFNPPYLKEDAIADPTSEGGTGLQVPVQFIQEAMRVVSRNGRVVFLLNQDADVTDFERECAKKGFEVRPLTERHLFYERLTVYEASASRPQSIR